MATHEKDDGLNRQGNDNQVYPSRQILKPDGQCTPQKEKAAKIAA